MPKVSFGGAEWTMMSPLEIESTGGEKSLILSGVSCKGCQGSELSFSFLKNIQVIIPTGS